MELGTLHKTEHVGNGELRIAAKVRRAETGPAVSHKMDLTENGEVCNAACLRWAETDLLASHKMQHAGKGAVHHLWLCAMQNRWKWSFANIA